MKTLAAMLGIGKSFWVLFLIPHLGIWNIDGETCNAQIHIKRDTMYNALAGKSFQLDCPVDKCANTHNVTWCKIEGEKCPLLGETHHRKMKQNEKKDILVYSLYFDQALASDNGSYRCSANVSSGLLESYSITLYVTEQTQNSSEHPLINVTSTSEPPSKNEVDNGQLILYSLVPLGGLPLVITCFYLFCCLRRHRGEQKKPSDTAERRISLQMKCDRRLSYHAKVSHDVCGLIKEETFQTKKGCFGGSAKFFYKFLEYKLRPFFWVQHCVNIGTQKRKQDEVDVPQPCGSEQTKKSTRQNSQNLPLETEVYDNDPWCGVQEEPGVYSIQCLEENRQGVVYASLNHSVIEMNQRQARNMKEAPTEYAAICVRS